MTPEERLRELSGKATATAERMVAMSNGHPRVMVEVTRETFQDLLVRPLVLSRNLIDPLVEVVLAARLLSDPFVRGGDGNRWWAAHDALDAALAALDAAGEDAA